MQVQVQREQSYYKLQVIYSVPADLQTSWELIATNSGFARWFPQLRIDGNQLIFEMENFREEMNLLTYQKPDKIAYSWDTAQVSFTLSQTGERTSIIFEESIPEDFGNEFTNAKQDMTGWLVQNERIAALLDGLALPEIAALQEKWGQFLEDELAI